MWVFTEGGFFSAVADRADPSAMVVRARVREDLAQLLALLPRGTRVEATPRADYAFRLRCSKERLGVALGVLAKAVDYDNFKNRVHARHEPARNRAYMAVWSAMYALQPTRHCCPYHATGGSPWLGCGDDDWRTGAAVKTAAKSSTREAPPKRAHHKRCALKANHGGKCRDGRGGNL